MSTSAGSDCSSTMSPVSTATSVPAHLVRVGYDPGQVDVERMKEVLEEEQYPVASVEPAGPSAHP